MVPVGRTLKKSVFNLYELLCIRYEKPRASLSNGYYLTTTRGEDTMARAIKMGERLCRPIPSPDDIQVMDGGVIG